ncbi:MAG TPA: hypothetical protein VGE10_05380 [Zeimonas sp.]
MPKLVPVSRIVDACRAANLPDSVAAAIALDPQANGSQAAIDRAVSEASEVLALARMSGFVADEYGATDRDATERAALAMIVRRTPIDDVRTAICKALADQDAATHIDTSRRTENAVFSPWAARAAEGVAK